MIYGYDEAVRYPVKDLYDTGMMNLYIGAIKDEYERGLKEQEEFVSKYGDFISPFQKDVESWDNLTMDPFIETYDYLVKHGIDPLRSQEGRAAMAQVRRNVPREKLSMLRQSAAAGQEYLKNRGEMQAKGLYNPEFEQFLLGDRTFNDQDTLSQGMWSRTSPTEFKGLRTLTDPWFKHRTAKFDAELTKKKNDGFQYYTYTRDDMYKAANDQIQAFLGNDYGRFYYDRALKVAEASRQPGESDESVRKRAQDILINDITDINRDYLMEDRKTDPYALAELEYRNRLRLAGIQRRWAKEDAAEQQRNLWPGSWTGTLTTSVNSNKGNRDYNRLRGILVEYQQHNERISKNPKVSAATRAKAKKAADYYKRAVENYDNGTAWGTRDKLGNIVPTAAGYKILNGYDRKHGYNAAGSKFDSAISSYLNNNVANITDPSSVDMSYNFVYRGASKLPGQTSNNQEYGFMSFGGNNNFMRYRAAKASGYGITSGSLSKKFNDYLRKNRVNGYVIKENQIGVGRTPKKSGQGASYDFYYDVYVPNEVIENFAETVGMSADKVRSRLGLQQQTVGERKTNSYTTESVQMTRIKAATTSDENALKAWENAYMDKTFFGTSNAYNLAPTRQAESIDNSTR